MIQNSQLTTSPSTRAKLGTGHSNFLWPVVGHKNIINFLQKSIVNDRLAHAYLFYGPEHIGKEMVANYFAASLLCQELRIKNQESRIPCKECVYCQQVFKGIHPDIYRLEKQQDKKNIGIDEIRQLQRKLSLSSLTGSYKIAIINNADDLSLEAANSLLKTIEEPSEKAIIILLARHINLLPLTIHSRCRILRFLPVSKEEISLYLKKNFNLSETRARELVHLARGLPGLAVSFVLSPKVLNDRMEQIKEFISIADGDIVRRFSILQKLLSPNKEKLNWLLSIWQSVVRDLFLIKNKQEDLVINFFIKPKLKTLASKYSAENLVSILTEIAKTRQYLAQNVNPRLALENLILKF